MPRTVIALASLGDPTDSHTWSGTPAHMLSGFAANGVEVVPVGVHSPLSRPLMIASRVRSTVSRQKHVFVREPFLQRDLARRFAAQLDRIGKVDLVVALGAFTVDIPRDDLPVVFWTDATLEGLVGYYDEWSDFSPRTLRQFRDAERASLRRTDLFVAASEWAAETVRRENDLPAERVAVVPFGANTDPVPSPAVRPTGSPVRILSVGIGWRRKGLDIAVEAVDRLRQRGVLAVLDIVGSDPPPGVVLPDFVTCHGLGEKSAPDGRRLLDDLYRQADVFLLPTRGECFGVVFCEAAAYGVPVVATHTGGVPTAVLDEVTGLLVHGERPDDFAGAVYRIVTDAELRVRLQRQGRARYERELNWERATGRVVELARERGLIEGARQA